MNRVDNFDGFLKSNLDFKYEMWVIDLVIWSKINVIIGWLVIVILIFLFLNMNCLFVEYVFEYWINWEKKFYM